MNKKDREELEQIITLAIERAVMPDGRFNYYQATENVLYSYPRLRRIVSDFDAYMMTQDKSKSITSGQGSGSYKAPEDVREEAMIQRLESFDRTKKELYIIDTILNQFRNDESFKVIEMYYFGLDENGAERGGEQMTFGEIATALSRTEKTVRSWRTKIVKSIAVLLFGAKAAPTLNRLTK